MESPMRHEIATRLRKPGPSDIWLAAPVMGRTRHLAAQRLRPVPLSRRSYPTLSYLAHAVLAQAVKDATPECDRGGVTFRDTISRRRRQCESLLWLCSTDADLRYWSELAEYPLPRLHAKFRPLLLHFVTQHPTIACSFSLPEWLRAGA